MSARLVPIWETTDLTERPDKMNKCTGDKQSLSISRNAEINCSMNDEFEDKLPGVIDAIVATLHNLGSPDHVGCPTVPSRECLASMVDLYEKIVFPGYFGTQEVNHATIKYYTGNRVHRLYRILAEQIAKCLRHECPRDREHCIECYARGRKHAYEFLETLPNLRNMLGLDVEAAFRGDPAASSHEEIIFCYPGVRAVAIFRFAHELFIRGIPIIPRMLTEYAHTLTGCDIHPGATIGKSFFIDHATGVVIGETAVIGDNVRIYQGVTLGGLSYKTDKDGRLFSTEKKRHPTLEDNVVVYANATILGGKTVVGEGSIIGGNVWVTESVAPGSRMMHNPENGRIHIQPDSTRRGSDKPATGGTEQK